MVLEPRSTLDVTGGLSLRAFLSETESTEFLSLHVIPCQKHRRKHPRRDVHCFTFVIQKDSNKRACTSNINSNPFSCKYMEKKVL